jgi:hypothetical protein
MNDPDDSEVKELAPSRAKRSKRSILIELLLWALFTVAVALAMIVFSERYLPTNF